MSRKLSPTSDVLYRLKRGLSGYISYLAACEMNEAFSEYVLYEPSLRIMTARGFHVACEYPCPGYDKVGRGDHKKIDFLVARNGDNFALEMKWAKKAKIDIAGDVEKLKKYIEHNVSSRAFLCVFGRKSHIENISLNSDDLSEHGKPIYAEFGVTKYGVRVYTLKNG